MYKATTQNIELLVYFRGLFQLMKPRVMSLVIFTCIVGLLIAPKEISFLNAILSLFAVALGAGAAGTLNMWYEADVDALMSRTCLRPIPSGTVSKNQALFFGIITSVISVITLYFFSNFVASLTLAVTILFYVFIYTIWLKRKTPQNIVIGGAAGALPPIIGWSIATSNISLEPILLFLIIFFWTPSHFWALSLYKTDDYKKANIPMLPITAGIKTTKINIFVYSLILFAVALTPFFFNYSSIIYFILAFVLGLYYVYLCSQLLIEKSIRLEKKLAKKIFFFSILYLFLIFTIILIDKVW